MSPGSHPWWRPYSVAWIVDTSGTLKMLCSVRGVGDEPVVGMDDVHLLLVEQGHPDLDEAEVELQHPRHEVFEGDLGWVLRHAMHVDAVAHLLERRLGRIAGEDEDVVSLRRERLGQAVHMAPETTDDPGRELPREHEHTHGGAV